MPASGYFAEVGRALRLVRGRSKRTLTAVAKSAGLTKSQLSKYETSRELPKMQVLAQVLDSLGVEPLWFFYLVHQLSREDLAAGLQVDLLLLPGAGSPLAPDEKESFRRHLDTLLELHVTVVRARLEQGPK